MANTSVKFVVIGLLLLHATLAAAFNYTVINNNDSGIGSLRAAIISANASAGADQIRFNIAGGGVQVIAPITPLPTITEALTIDGYTQSGSTFHSAAATIPGVVRIQLDGSNAGASAGLGVCASNVIIRGLSITRFSKHGITLGQTNTIATCPGGTGADNAQIQGNYLGIAADGVTAAGNVLTGLLVGDSSSVSLDNNVIGSNKVHGIQIANSTAVDVTSNLIGMDVTATLDRGNQSDGVNVTGGSSVIGIGASSANRIGYNRNGVMVGSTVIRANAARNDYIANDVLGIDLSGEILPDGPTANDSFDIDAGGNNLQNFPDSLVASRTPTGISVAGTVARPNAGAIIYSVTAYAIDACGPNGRGGGRYLGSAGFNTAAGPVANFSVAIPVTVPLPVGSLISTTLTDTQGNTSEMSPCVNVDTPLARVVTNTADSGVGSLRQAIIDANAVPGGDVVQFNIPGGGVQVIVPDSALPAISEAVLIDGYTQPGASANNLGVGDNAVIHVELRGTFAGALSSGLDVRSNNVQIRGLSITGFDLSGISVGSDETVAYVGTRIDGNFIGIRPDGVTGAGNGNTGLNIRAAKAVAIGDATPAGRNLIAANGVGANNGSQILAASALTSSILVRGNYLGTASNGQTPLANSRAGIWFNGNNAGSTIGGSDSNAQNRITAHIHGILVGNSANGITVAGNAITGNSELAIDLGPAMGFGGDGVTPNDVDDGDSGANLLQNFPVLSSVQVYDGGLRVLGGLDRTNAAGPRDFVLRFYADNLCDASGHGEAATFLGEKPLVLDTPSDETFDVQLNASVSVGQVVSATATTSGGTSEFSTCTVVTLGDVIFADGLEN